MPSREGTTPGRDVRGLVVGIHTTNRTWVAPTTRIRTGTDDPDLHLGHHRLKRRRRRGATGSLRQGTEGRHRPVAILRGGKVVVVVVVGR
jgi:hypothetical protein